MRAILFKGPGNLQLIELPTPAPSQGEVRLKVLQAGICATDIHILKGHFPVLPPRILGHEFWGLVEAVGPGVSEEWLGRVCGVRPARFCGICPPCRQGFPELCLNFQCLGNTQDGGYAENVILGTDQLVFLAEAKPDLLVWLEPLACVLHALNVCRADQGENLLVIGAGVFGKLIIHTLSLTTSVPLAVVDPNPDKIRQALSHGARQGWVVPHREEPARIQSDIRSWAPDGVQVVIDTTGDPDAIRNALDWVRPGGRVLLFGVSDPNANLAIQPNLIFSKELTLQASAGMSPASFDAAIGLVLGGMLDLSYLVSAVIDLDQVPGAFEEGTLFRKGKVLIQPNGEMAWR